MISQESSEDKSPALVFPSAAMLLDHTILSVPGILRARCANWKRESKKTKRDLADSVYYVKCLASVAFCLLRLENMEF
jgi:hypothetical protein